jgi:hypothetical protein
MKAILLCGWGANHSEPLQISSPCRRAARWISVDWTRAAEGEEAVAGGCLGDAWSFVEQAWQTSLGLSRSPVEYLSLRGFRLGVSCEPTGLRPRNRRA